MSLKLSPLIQKSMQQPLWKHKQNIRKIKFKGKSIFLKTNPRTGVCSQCRAVAGIDCDRTALHHEKYDRNNPLAHTIELCFSCHARRHAMKPIYPNRGHFYNVCRTILYSDSVCVVRLVHKFRRC